MFSSVAREEREEVEMEMDGSLVTHTEYCIQRVLQDLQIPLFYPLGWINI